ncbi:MAG: eS6 family ribosomal protein [Candidatus Heimdallarchaeota archaeon]|nr:eS6 family ribosomal protein [Candidatus Heimdallarchaeota archaeon]MDH5646602.1 eS6 family ribosomal protein [Candidatus Heimdallarchaeota archaeon]
MAERTIINIGQKDGKTAKIIIEGDARAPLYGLNVGQEFEGDIINPDYNGYTFKITGGSDDTGTPMRFEIEGPIRKKLLLSGGVGYRKKVKGLRKRKLIRGAEVQDDIAQLNVKVIKEGNKPLLQD